MDTLQRHWLEFLLGALLVVQFAYKRFDDPPTQKYSTTSRQYHTAWVMYTLLWLACWLILSLVPTLLTPINGPPDALKALDSPLFVALAFTVLLAEFPILKDFEYDLRKFFWEKASIPHEARELALRLNDAQYELPPHIEPKVHARLPFIENFKDAGKSIEKNPCIKITALLIQVEAWHKSRRYTNFAKTISRRMDDLRFRYKEYHAEIEESYRCQNKHIELLPLVQQRIDANQPRLIESLMQTIAQGVIFCDQSEFERKHALKKLGITITLDPDPDSHVLIFVFSVILAMFVIWFTMLTQPADPNSLLHAFVGAARIAITDCLAVAAAISCRRRTSAGENEIGIRSRIPSYAISAWLAFMAWLVVTLVAYYLQGGTRRAAVLHLTQIFPYALMPLTISAVTAVLMDLPARHRAWLRDGLILATSCFLASALALLMLQHLGTKHYIVSTLVMSSLIGLFIGMLIPSWYRKRPPLEESESATPSTFQPAHNAPRAASERSMPLPDDAEGAMDPYS